jgi:DNA-binding CsgD family transcriptional regulator
MRRFCDCLKQLYDINYFCYHKVTHDGFYNFFGSSLDWIEYFLDQRLYLKCGPYLRHPDNFQSGYIFTANDDAMHAEFQEVQQVFEARFLMRYCFVLFNKQRDYVEGFWFGVPSCMPNPHARFSNQMPRLKAIVENFCKEFKRPIDDISGNLQSLADVMGSNFYEKTSLFPQDTEENKRALLKLLGLELPKLSKREKEVLPLCLKRSTYRDIGKKLSISYRTVEHRVDSLKDKFGCCTKSELVEKLQIYRDVIDLFL